MSRPDFASKWKTIETIPGWLSLEAGALLDAVLRWQERHAIGGDRLEIGVRFGRSAALLAEGCAAHGGRLFLVERHGERDGAAIRTNVRKLAPELDDARLLVIPAVSRDLLHRPELAEARSRFAFQHIDGEHTGAAVYRDLATADELAGETGAVMLDDFLHPTFPQITEAVYRYLFLHPYSFVLILAGYYKGLLVRPKFAHRYATFCRDELVTALEERGVSAVIQKRSSPEDCATYGIGRRGPDGLRYVGPNYDIGERFD